MQEADRPAPQGLEWLSKPRRGGAGAASWNVAPVALVDASACRERSTRPEHGSGRAAGGTSYRNDGEARLAVRAACAVARGGDVESIAILAPYRGQVCTPHQKGSLYARRGPHVRSAGLRCSRGQKRLPEICASVQVPALEAEVSRRSEALMDRAGKEVRVRVSTVDGFQGREADVVVFSATRNNAGRRLGFVRDVRRLNVALTRARRGLVVVAAPEMLEADPVWGKCASGCLRCSRTWCRLALLARNAVLPRPRATRVCSLRMGTCRAEVQRKTSRMLQVAHVGAR